MKKRLAIIKKEKCNPIKCSHECAKYCPVNRQDKKCIIIDNKAEIDEDLCTGCSICVKRCPFQAIDIVNLPEQLKVEPIHRYGNNGFALYRLPVPRFGKVVGILGRNGIGKTTAINILAGLLKPNLGKEEVSYNEIIDYFKGSESQNYFEKLKNNEIKISYKLQKVDTIPDQYKGKVKDLLKKVDEKKQLNEIAKKLEIDKILDNNISEISGGELQRVAIAACVLKKANVYFFDEPSSYLDIKQRLKIAKFIKDLSNEDIAIIVIEHDLIVLDYLTDLVHIMYGKPGCYGVTSLLKASKAGINSYLEGYLKEENMRFRDKKIEFSEKAPMKISKRDVLTEWSEFEKKLGNFHLKSEFGHIKKNEIVGIIGQNAIGKTTFVKILCGLIKADKGKIDLQLNLSYKPQYLKQDSKEFVSELINKTNSEFKNLIVRLLELEDLMLKHVNELSGGELQRVAIAQALLQEADLVLMDEPSAYLDVEQRLNCAKVINEIVEKKNVSALIVDHDLLFIDYLSNELIVFEGEAALHGNAKGPFSMEDGMNKLLKELDISLRRDEENKRPRINKPGSVIDRKQKQEGNLYYS